MKKLIIILFAISLYTPEAVQILDFSQCLFVVFTTPQGELCDCMFTNTGSNNLNENKAKTAHDHKHKDVKKIEKNVFEADYRISSKASIIQINHFTTYHNLISSNYLQEVFHPPAIKLS